MALHSGIEWTDATWNPVTGCTKTSPGCRHCYAEVLAERLRRMGQPKYARGFRVTLHADVLDAPLAWRAPRTVFVNSMSDLFHEDVPADFVARVFDVMRRAYWHYFQVLTKRSARMVELSPYLPWPSNVWVGVSVENSRYVARIDHLRRVPAAVRFLSIEPMLGPLPDLNLEGIDWVIVGGESGPGARPMDPRWVVNVRDRCLAAGVPFFFKQWGGTRRRASGRLLEGRTWDQMPVMPLSVGGRSPVVTHP